MEPQHVQAHDPTADHRRRGAARPIGQRLLIRPVRPEDDSELLRLHEALDVDDRYWRFFSASSPPLEFFTDLTTVHEHGGARLVAVLHRPFSDDRIIGEAGYNLLPNGDGELEITVERGVRGWLAPYLLDALVELAAQSAVPNLEADVLTVNAPMLALLRSHGSVMMRHEGWRVVRLLIGTDGRGPTWPGPHDRPRVLIERQGGRWPREDEANGAGFDLLVCAGATNEERECPLQVGEPCPLAAEADIIVMSHPSGDDHWQTLVAGHAEFHPGVPVFIDTSSAQIPITTCVLVHGADGASILRDVADRALDAG